MTDTKLGRVYRVERHGLSFHVVVESPSGSGDYFCRNLLTGEHSTYSTSEFREVVQEPAIDIPPPPSHNMSQSDLERRIQHCLPPTE
jgi:hypothetical protein